MKKHWKKIMNVINECRSDIEKTSNQESFYQNQALMLNTLFLVDEIFTGKFRQPKVVDGKYQLFESKRNQKESYTVTQ